MQRDQLCTLLPALQFDSPLERIPNGRGLFVALLLFVGIPLPGTGAWTGTLAASFLDMDFKSSVLAVMGGVLLAGVIMGLASAGLFGALNHFILG